MADIPSENLLFYGNAPTEGGSVRHGSRWLLAAFLLVGCGDDSTGPDMTAEDFVGTWSVEIPAEAGCWSAFELRFDVEPADAEGVTGEEFNFVSVWYFPPPSSGTSTFTGSFNWGEEDQFTFVFNTEGSTSIRMEGNNVNEDEVTGIFQDRDGIVFEEGCSATATATKL
jgi:hypothetical protein